MLWYSRLNCSYKANDTAALGVMYINRTWKEWRKSFQIVSKKLEKAIITESPFHNDLTPSSLTLIDERVQNEKSENMSIS